MEPEETGLLFAALEDDQNTVAGLVLDTGTDILARDSRQWVPLDDQPSVSGKTLKQFPSFQIETVIRRFDAGVNTVLELVEMDPDNG